MSQNPNDLKFLFRYGLFLLNILNNEYDALELFKKLQISYEGRSGRKAAGGTTLDDL
jgi:hypothetical protein